VPGDAERLLQVVWNLLSNAVKFTPRGGRVQVRLERVNSHIEIIVSDTGIGIPAAFLPHLFQRFRQAEAGTTRRHGGLGLGLAIVRHLVEMHGGTSHAASDGEGCGATFRVKLPLMIVHAERHPEQARVHPRVGIGSAMGTSVGSGQNAGEGAGADQGLGLRQGLSLGEGAQGEGATEAEVSVHGIHVLAVDDDRDALGLLRDILEAAGATVTLANSAAAALDALHRLRPHVLIADLGMPEVDGLELIARVRKLPDPDLSGTPAAALTAYARSDDRARSLRAGFGMHLAKPIDPGELIAAVTALARRR
jgi:CheY-like chemotaxis protein